MKRINWFKRSWMVSLLGLFVIWTVVANAQTVSYPEGSYGLWPLTMVLSARTDACLTARTAGQGLMANPGVVGILLSVPWNQIERSDGVFDWSVVQRRLCEAQQCGIKVALSLGISLVQTPDWLTYDSGSSGYSDYGVQLVDLPAFGVVPVFWDDTFNWYRIRFIQAAAAFLATLPPAVSSNVVAVSAQPLGARTNDWLVPNTEPQIAAWLQAGYRADTPDGQPSSLMLSTATRIIDEVVAAFPDKNIKLPFHVTAEALDGTKIALAAAVLNYAYDKYPSRFYAQLNILKTVSPLSCPAPCALDAAGDNHNPLSLFRLLRDYRAQGYKVGIQMVAGVVNGFIDDCRQNGNRHPCSPCETPPVSYATVLQASVNVGLSYRPTYFEFWNGDARTVAGSANPCPVTDPEKAAMRQVFRSATLSMGGRPRP